MGQRPPFSSSSKGTISSNPGSADRVENEAEVEELPKDRHVSDEPGLCPLATGGHCGKEHPETFSHQSQECLY